jgi:hypothetical protein
MKIIIFLLLPFFAMSQPLPEGCFKQINVPAEYIDQNETITIDAVVYSVPKIEYKETKVMVKEKAYESYYECAPDGTLNNCTRTIEPQYETIKTPVIVSYESITLVPSSTKTITKKVKVKDGYIATVPCDKIVIQK